MTLNELHDVLVEVGQELDSDQSRLPHEVGVLMMIAASMLGGAPPSTAARTAADYHQAWANGERPYAPLEK